MDYDEAMEGHRVTVREAVAELKDHGIETRVDGGQVLALEMDPSDPALDHWVPLELNSAAILEWLGY